MAHQIRAVLNQCDSPRSAVVKRACESLRLLMRTHQANITSPVWAEVVKRLLKLSGSKLALIPDHAVATLHEIVAISDDLTMVGAVEDQVLIRHCFCVLFGVLLLLSLLSGIKLYNFLILIMYCFVFFLLRSVPRREERLGRARHPSDCNYSQAGEFCSRVV
jgi:hypothetical protein